MIRKQIDFHSEEINKIRTLYQQAFPKNEQTNLTWLFDDLHKGIIYGYYQEEKLIGFTILCIHHQIVSILYLAVKEEYRNLGYGSMILEDLSKKYVSNRIMLDIEQIKECKNKEQRIKRKQFYLRNGFQEMGFKYVEKDVKYEMLYVGEKLSSKVYDELMVAYAGPVYHKFRDYKADELID